MPPTTIDVLPDELLQLIFVDFSRFQLYHICLVSQRFSALATGPLYQKISTSSLSSKKFTALLVSLCLHQRLALHVRYLKLRLRNVSLDKPFSASQALRIVRKHDFKKALSTFRNLGSLFGLLSRTLQRTTNLEHLGLVVERAECNRMSQLLAFCTFQLRQLDTTVFMLSKMETFFSTQKNLETLIVRDMMSLIESKAPFSTLSLPALKSLAWDSHVSIQVIQGLLRKTTNTIIVDLTSEDKKKTVTGGLKSGATLSSVLDLGSHASYIKIFSIRFANFPKQVQVEEIPRLLPHLASLLIHIQNPFSDVVSRRHFSLDVPC